jgi:hypothetical protein
MDRLLPRLGSEKEDLAFLYSIKHHFLSELFQIDL